MWPRLTGSLTIPRDATQDTGWAGGARPWRPRTRSGGGVWGKLRDKAIKDDELRKIGESIPPGTSAIIAAAEDRVVERLERGIQGYEKVARHALSAEASAELVAKMESGPGNVGAAG